MTTIRQSDRVNFNGTDSSTFGIFNCNIDTSGLLSEPIWGSRSVNKTKTRGRKQPYLHSVEEDVLSFTLQLAVEDPWDDDTIQQIKQWLRGPTPSYYAPLIFSAMPDKIYWAIPVGQPNLVHNASNQGYIEANFECNAPNAYSDYISESHDLSTNPSGTVISLQNNGDENITPIFNFTKVGAGDITITNLSYAQDSLVFSGVQDKEVIQIDENEIIQSQMSAVLSFTGGVSDGETITISSRTYQYSVTGSVTAGNVLVDVSEGTTMADGVNQLVSAINSDPFAVVTAVAGVGTTSVVVTTKQTGFPNSNFSLSETCANASWDITTLINSYRDSLWNGNQITLKVGSNNLKVSGTGTFTITYRYVLY